MPEYLSPGVYVEEIDTGNKPIEGVSTSTVGFLGITERGPVEPALVTSFGEYVRNFGRYVPDHYLPHAVEGFFQNGGKRCFIARVVSGDPQTAAATLTIGDMIVTSLGVGTWANGHLAIKVTDAGLDPVNRFKLTIVYWDPTVTVPTPIVDPTDTANRNDPNRREPVFVEVFDNLSADLTKNTFFERQVNDFSHLVALSHPAGNNNPARPANTALTLLAGGNDGAALTLADFEGDPAANPGEKRGLAAFEEVDDIAILCCPDEPDFPQITDKLVSQCENLKDRFVIIQAPLNAPSVGNHLPTAASKYAAYYYPWLEIFHPVKGEVIAIPPGGHVAGIYARTDIERGVHKAPANAVIRGLDSGTDGTGGLQVPISKGQQDLLNPRGVNVLRYFPGYGNLVWGARTTALDPDWKYVNVRRLFIFVEESIEQATQWAVFEPNDEPLWSRLRRSVSAFLRRLWMDGMLQGEKAEKAYFVRCDRTTMTQADIDLGRLIMVIGIAPVKPAEFVIFRIGQWDGGSSVEEI